jgi:polyisoprenyl-phosphate glycosyltransferase
MKHEIELSIVSPVYKADNLVDKLVERIIKAVSKLTENYEIILVEDCGPDDSWQKIQEICEKYPFVKGIKLSINCGQQHAIQAGLDESKGKYVITMDCDLQDRPEEIHKLYSKAKEGYEIVVASRQNRQDDVFKKFLSKIFYKILGYLTETEQDSSVANFVLYHRSVIDALARMHDNNRYYPMLHQLVGFNSTKVEVEHASREEGESSYSIKKRLNLALNTTLSFSDKPLRLIVKFGIFLSFISFCSAIILVILYFLRDVRVAGWASLAMLLSFFSGTTISVLGMVGLYVGRIFDSVKNRPNYIIHKTIN